MKREDILCCFHISPIPSLPLPINQQRWVPNPYSRISTGAGPRHSPCRGTSRAAPGSPVAAQHRRWAQPSGTGVGHSGFGAPPGSARTPTHPPWGGWAGGSSSPPRGPARARALSPLCGRGSARLRAGLAPTPPPPPPRGSSLTVSSLRGLQRDGTGRAAAAAPAATAAASSSLSSSAAAASASQGRPSHNGLPLLRAGRARPARADGRRLRPIAALRRPRSANRVPGAGPLRALPQRAGKARSGDGEAAANRDAAPALRRDVIAARQALTPLVTSLPRRGQQGGRGACGGDVTRRQHLTARPWGRQN